MLRQMQLAKALQATEPRLLEAQLNPHFLFNALNGIRALIADEPARAQDAVTQLAHAALHARGRPATAGIPPSGARAWPLD